jgi:hypothetical protein
MTPGRHPRGYHYAPNARRQGQKVMLPGGTYPPVTARLPHARLADFDPHHNGITAVRVALALEGSTA